MIRVTVVLKAVWVVAILFAVLVSSVNANSWLLVLMSAFVRAEILNRALAPVWMILTVVRVLVLANCLVRALANLVTGSFGTIGYV